MKAIINHVRQGIIHNLIVLLQSEENAIYKGIYKDYINKLIQLNNQNS